ncbi:diacylglycerol kinase epsilon isoform X2 [Centruroides vittatus]
MWFLPTPGESSIIFQVSFYASVIMLTTVFLWKIFRRQCHYEIPARDISKGHSWCVIDIFSQTAYCIICKSLIVDGWYCDSCGVYADQSCFKKADKSVYCKSLSGVGNSMKHHWVKGNLKSGSICDVCETNCGTEDCLADFRCCWCQRTVHSDCLQKMSEICDLGRFKSFIVPPFCVRLKLVGIKGRRHLVVSEVRPPVFKPWNPLIVIANRKSGNNEGSYILNAFRSVLNPAQVIDIHDVSPENGLEWCHLISNHTCRILIAGGDGTISWVLNIIDKLKIEPLPHICIVPLGTGNDLARVLGWGSGSSGVIDVKKILNQIDNADTVNLDRWKVKIIPKRHLGIQRPPKEIYMNNYASVGVDALVALNFHKTRESKLYFYGSRLLNKFLYMSYGTKDLLERECKNLHQKLDLQLDGRNVQLPEVEAIVVLNIPSWGAGIRPWTMGKQQNVPVQRYDDGILEVIGIYSSFHIAQLHIGLSEPVRLGQAKEVKINLHERLPVQVDGEPWEQFPSSVIITHLKQVTMLYNYSQE